PALDALVPSLEGVGDPVGSQLEFLESVLLRMELKLPVMVVGKTGTGKTMLMRYLAHQLNLPLREQAFNADMTEDHLFATPVINEHGEVEYREQPLTKGVKYGGMVVADEVLTLRNRVREKFNPVTEGAELQITQKRPPEVIKKADWHEDFYLLFTTNG